MPATSRKSRPPIPWPAQAVVTVVGIFALAGLSRVIPRASDLHDDSPQTNSQSGEQAAGADATKPQQIPARGWKEIARRTRQAMKTDKLGTLAAGVSYYATLAVFPGLIAIVTIFGLIANPATIVTGVEQLQGVVPDQLMSLFVGQLKPLISHSHAQLGLGALASTAVLLWSASSGMQGLIQALNQAYHEDEDRNIIQMRGISLGLTLLAVVVFLLVFPILVLSAKTLAGLHITGLSATAIAILRWPVLVVIAAIFLAAIYRYAPNRRRARWQWVSWGAAAATVIWLLASIGFFFYAQHFGSYNKTYGSVSAVAILMIWLYLSALAILLGASLNHQMESQTDQPTTTSKVN
jgi:membrane protein